MTSNTPETQALLPVTAEDIEMAHAVQRLTYGTVPRGEVVQLFARHRLAALTPSALSGDNSQSSSNAGGVEIARLVKNFITAHDLSAADPASAELESRELDAISDLRCALASLSTPTAEPMAELQRLGQEYDGEAG